MKPGIDYIGGVNYIKRIVKRHPKGWAGGFLCKATGWKNGIRAARALAKTGKCPVMRIHGLWHDNHYFDESDIKPAVREAKRVAKLADKYPDIRFYYSPWLEHRASPRLFTLCAEACEEVLPKGVRIVNSGPPSYGINEVHHGHPVPGKYIFSYDGADCFEESVDYDKRRHDSAILFFFWTPRCNGKKALYDSTPRPEREHWLRRKDFRAIKRLW